MSAISTTGSRTAAAGLGRLTAALAPGLDAHLQRHGVCPHPGPALVDEIEAAGLTGRGGAAFPTWRKLAAVGAAARGSRRSGAAVVVANGAEGEPASAKDAALLVNAPHLVLDGLQLAAEAVGAGEAYMYVGEHGRALEVVSAAVRERRERGHDRLGVEVLRAPDTFVAGEESAVVAALEGAPALPRFKARMVVESGVRGRPTLVQNVETLAHVALIARHGSAWFRGAGEADQPGTFLATLSGAVRRPGVVEAAYGTSLGQLLELAGGSDGPLSAVLVGGYHGAWLPMPQAFDTAMSRRGLSPWGASPGAGVVVALPSGSCGLQATAGIVDYLAAQTAAQCGPCLNGLPAMASTMSLLARGRADAQLPARLARLAELVCGRGACQHPDGTVRLLRSALRTFGDDVSAHLEGRCLVEH